MKKHFLLLLSCCLILCTQACTKCGHCETTTIDSFTGGKYIEEGPTYCGDDEKAGRINCERADDQSDAYSSYKWISDK